MTRPLYISVHIPKTGGTSLNNELRRQIEGASMSDYADKPLSGQWRIACTRAWRRWRIPFHRNQILRDYRLIFGHFSADKYLPLGREHLFYLCFLRDPVERTISHYHYWKNLTATRDPAEIQRQPLLKALIEDDLSLEAFAAHPSMRHIYRRFFGRMSPLDFDFVGITEHYGRSMQLLSTVLNTNLTVRHDNTAHGDNRPRLEGQTWRRLQAINAENRRYYQLAKQRFYALCAERGITIDESL